MWLGIAALAAISYCMLLIRQSDPVDVAVGKVVDEIAAKYQVCACFSVFAS